jgi:hypothetical protein
MYLSCCVQEENTFSPLQININHLMEKQNMHFILGSVDCMVVDKKYMFATVPESSINSCVSWFIFNLQKINTS